MTSSTPTLPAPSDLPPALDWLGAFSGELCLWNQDKAGHTQSVAHLARVHSYRTAAQNLLLASQSGQLPELPLAAILRAFAAAFATDEHGALRGPMRWYAEETEAADTNSAFFVCLPLLVLHCTQRAHLSDEESAEFARLFAGFDLWFDDEVARRAWHYPNKFMGDLVCSWLLKEVLGRTQTPQAAQTLAVMDEAAAYWQEQGWGWGEHLSDTYATVLLNELSSLLLFARQLPEALRVRYGTLFGELMRLEDAFDDRPRVPAIRSYAFSNVPRHETYRARIRPLAPGELPRSHFAAIFHAHGWHALAEEFAPPSIPSSGETTLETSCFGGEVARSYLAPDAGLGSLSRFPLMDGLDWPTWGLSWQSFPVAFWRRAQPGAPTNAGCWGFWEWSALEAGRERFHPAREQASSYLSNALTDAVVPSLSGHTFSVQHGAHGLFLRRMPGISTAWEHAGDGLRLLHGEDLDIQTWIVAGEDGVPCHLLHLSGTGWTLVVRFVALGASPTALPSPHLERLSANELRWTVRHDPQTWKGAGGFGGLWGVSLLTGSAAQQLPGVETAPLLHALPNFHPTPRPVLRARDTGAYQIEWAWPQGVWRGVVDPLAEQPLAVEWSAKPTA